MDTRVIRQNTTSRYPYSFRERTPANYLLTPPPPSAMETLGAAFRLESTFDAVGTWLGDTASEIQQRIELGDRFDEVHRDPDFDEYRYVMGTWREPFGGRYDGVRNETEAAYIDMQIKEELAAQEVLSRSRFAGPASLLAGIASPENAIPIPFLGRIGTGLVGRKYLLAGIKRNGPQYVDDLVEQSRWSSLKPPPGQAMVFNPEGGAITRLGKGAVFGAGVGAGLNLLSEAMLYHLQHTRPDTVFTEAMAFGGVLGGLIGGAGSMGLSRFKVLSDDLKGVVNGRSQSLDNILTIETQPREMMNRGTFYNMLVDVGRFSEPEAAALTVWVEETFGVNWARENRATLDEFWGDVFAGMTYADLGMFRSDPEKVVGMIHAAVEQGDTGRATLSELGEENPSAAMAALQDDALPNNPATSVVNPRGAFGKKGATTFLNDARAVIHLFPGRDITTVIHETAHVWSRNLPEADKNLLYKWAKSSYAPGLVEGTPLQTDVEEIVATALEDYMRNGRMPEGLDGKMKELFEGYARTMIKTYGAIKREKAGAYSHMPTTNSVVDRMQPEVKQLFDRWWQPDPRRLAEMADDELMARAGLGDPKNITKDKATHPALVGLNHVEYDVNKKSYVVYGQALGEEYWHKSRKRAAEHARILNTFLPNWGGENIQWQVVDPSASDFFEDRFFAAYRKLPEKSTWANYIAQLERHGVKYPEMSARGITDLVRVALESRGKFIEVVHTNDQGVADLPPVNINETSPAGRKMVERINEKKEPNSMFFAVGDRNSGKIHEIWKSPALLSNDPMRMEEAFTAYTRLRPGGLKRMAALAGDARKERLNRPLAVDVELQVLEGGTASEYTTDDIRDGDTLELDDDQGYYDIKTEEYYIDGEYEIGSIDDYDAVNQYLDSQADNADLMDEVSVEEIEPDDIFVVYKDDEDYREVFRTHDEDEANEFVAGTEDPDAYSIDEMNDPDGETEYIASKYGEELARGDDYDTVWDEAEEVMRDRYIEDLRENLEIREAYFVEDPHGNFIDYDPTWDWDDAADMMVTHANEDYPRTGGTVYGEYMPPGMEDGTYRETLWNLQEGPDPQAWDTSHWGDVEAENNLAHIRSGEYEIESLPALTVSGRKVDVDALAARQGDTIRLYHEFQSDWAQHARNLPTAERRSQHIQDMRAMNESREYLELAIPGVKTYAFVWQTLFKEDFVAYQPSQKDYRVAYRVPGKSEIKARYFKNLKDAIPFMRMVLGREDMYPMYSSDWARDLELRTLNRLEEHVNRLWDLRKRDLTPPKDALFDPAPPNLDKWLSSLVWSALMDEIGKTGGPNIFAWSPGRKHAYTYHQHLRGRDVKVSYTRRESDAYLTFVIKVGDRYHRYTEDSRTRLADHIGKDAAEEAYRMMETRTEWEQDAVYVGSSGFEASYDVDIPNIVNSHLNYILGEKKKVHERLFEFDIKHRLDSSWQENTYWGVDISAAKKALASMPSKPKRPLFQDEKPLFQQQQEARNHIIEKEIDRSQEMLLRGLEYFWQHEVEYTPEMLGGREPMFQTVALRTGEEDLSAYGFETGARENTKRMLGEALNARTIERYGESPLDDRGAEAVDRISDMLAEEVEYAASQPKSGDGWYTADYQRNLDELSRIWPELKEQQYRDLITIMFAVTSDGQGVEVNGSMAVQAYDLFTREGSLANADKFVSGGGTARTTIIKNLKMIDYLLEKHGIDGLRKELLEVDTVSAINARMRKMGLNTSSDYESTLLVPKAAAYLGPKIGMFFSNLMGESKYLTMDRWWTRTINRYRGHLLPTVSKNMYDGFVKGLRLGKKSPEEVGEAVKEYAARYGKRRYVTELEQRVGKKEGTKKEKRFLAPEQFAEAVEGLGLSDRKKKTLWRDHRAEKAANSLNKQMFTELRDSPEGAADRTFMIQVARTAVQKLKDRGIDLTTSNMQAIIWYYEKRLYKEQGVADSKDISYSDVAKDLVDVILAGRSDGRGNRTVKEILDERAKERKRQKASAGRRSGSSSSARPGETNRRGANRSNRGVGSRVERKRLEDGLDITRIGDGDDARILFQTSSEPNPSGLAPTGIPEFAFKGIAATAPAMRLASAKYSALPAEIYEKLGNTTTLLQKNLNNIATAQSVEVEATKSTFARIYDMGVSFNDEFHRYRLRQQGAADENAQAGVMSTLKTNVSDLVQGGVTRSARDRAHQEMISGQRPMDLQHFGRQVWEAWMDPQNPQFEPEAKRAAQTMRRIMDDVGEELITQKLMTPEQLAEASKRGGHRPRVWLTHNVRTYRDHLYKILWDQMDGKSRKTEEQISMLRNEINGILDMLQRHQTGYLWYDIKRGDDLRQMKSEPRTEKQLTVSPLLQRRLDVDEMALIDVELPDGSRINFIETDPARIMRTYLRTVTPDIELKKVFESIALENEIIEINDHYRQLSSEPPEGVTSEQVTKEWEQVLQDLNVVLDRIRGTDGIPADPSHWAFRLSNGILALNTMIYLGGVMLSSLPDIARPFFHRNFDMVAPHLKDLVHQGPIQQMAIRELKVMGAATDMITHATYAQLIDRNALGAGGTGLERFIQSAQDQFGLLSLMDFWNTRLKGWVGMIVQHEVLEAAQKARAGQALDEAQQLTFNQMGLSYEDLAEIGEAMQGHYERHGDIWLSKSYEWTDKAARKKYEHAVVKEIDQVITTPGAGDRPIFATKYQLGKHVAQFRSFSFASMRNTFVRGLQQGDRRTLQGVTFAMAMGATTYAIKEAIKGNELSSDPRDYLVEGIDRGGFMGWLLDLDNLIDTVTRGDISLRSTLGGEASRWRGRDFVDTILGPTKDTAENLMATMAGALQLVTQGQIDQSRIHSGWATVPFMKLPYLQTLSNYLRDEMKENLGAPPESSSE